MVCLPCQKKAEARKQAMLAKLKETNPEAAEKYKANVNVKENVKVLPRYEEGRVPITNTKVKPKTIWNEQYRTFIMNNN